MARSLCPDWPRITLAAGAALVALALPSASSQIATLLAGGLIGWRMLPAGRGDGGAPLTVPFRRGFSIAALLAFFALLLGLPLARAATANHLIGLFDGLFGALVFGGGHRAPLHFCGLSRRRHAASAKRSFGWDHLPYRNLPAFIPAAYWNFALLGGAQAAACRAVRARWCKCGGRWLAPRRALFPDLDGRDFRPGRFRNRAFGLCPARVLASAALDGALGAEAAARVP